MTLSPTTSRTAEPEPLTWTTVAGGVGFAGTWVDFGAPYGPVAYAADDNYGYLAGVAKDGVAATVFTLPVGFRPDVQRIWYFRSQAGGGFEITTAGVVTQFGSLGIALPFDGIVYRLA